jgi:hypothetical protein
MVRREIFFERSITLVFWCETVFVIGTTSVIVQRNGGTEQKL